MAIISAARIEVGQVGFAPGKINILTNNTVAESLAPGFFDGLNEFGIRISSTDLLYVAYTDGSPSAIYAPSIENGSIIIQPISGAVNGAENIAGSGEGLFADLEDSTLLFKKIRAGANITLSANDSGVTINASGGGGGGVDGAENVGGGDGVFAQQSGATLQFKSLVGDGAISISSDATEVTISSDAVEDGANLLGTGEGVFAQKNGSDLEFKRIKAGTNVTVSADANEITISSSGAAGAENLGTGQAVYAQQAGQTLQFKTLKAGSNVTLTSSGTEVTIASSGGGGGGGIDTGENLGAGEGVYADVSGSAIQFKSLVAGSNVTISSDSEEITISASGGGGSSFDYPNTYYLATNGNNSNSGKNINAPKATLDGPNGIIANLVDPSANNVVIVLDGGTYLHGSPVVLDATNLTIQAPNAKFESLTSDLFTLQNGSNLTITVREIECDATYNVIRQLDNGYFVLRCGTCRGNVRNDNGSSEFYCGTLYGDIIATGFIKGDVGVQISGDIAGRFLDLGAWMPQIEYNAPQTITIDSSYIGKLVILNSSAGSNYTINLPNFTVNYVDPGSYFYVFQAGTDKVVFDAVGGSVFYSDADSGRADRTKFAGCLIRVTCTRITVNTVWSISGGLERTSSQDILYVSKANGDDTNDGYAPDAPFATFGAAITAAGTPSSRFGIVGLDAETYDENLSITNPNIGIWAPLAKLAPATGNALTINVTSGNNSARFGEISPTSGSAVVVSGTSNVSFVNSEVITGAVSVTNSKLTLIGANITGNLSTSGGSAEININCPKYSGTATGNVFGLTGNTFRGTLNVPGQLNGKYIAAGSSGTEGWMDVYPSTANRGKLRIHAVPNDVDNYDTDLYIGGGDQSTILYSTVINPDYNYGWLQICPNESDPCINVMSKTITINYYDLAGGAELVLIPSSLYKQYVIMNIIVNYSGDNFSGGNRNLSILSSPNSFTTISSANMLTIGSSNAQWGDLILPYPTGNAMTVPTVAGAAVIAKYVGGSADYTFGSFDLTIVYRRIA